MNRLPLSLLQAAFPRLVLVVLLGMLIGSRAEVDAATRTERALERGFTETVHPFLESYCFPCHGAEKQKGKLDLRPYSSVAAIARDHRQWEIVRDKLKGAEMPPEDAGHQPTPQQRQAVIGWIQALRKHEAERNAGDPGPVPARRLSNAEYDHTIRDLTGVDIRPAREFPVDPANEAGFDNSAESLTMSPALVKKQLDAARRVAEHLVLKPHGFTFAPHPAVTETDRDKFCVKRLIDFYQKQPTNYADYFLAAWRFKHRTTLGKPKATLAGIAAAENVSPKYLEMIWSALSDGPDPIGPMAGLRTMWAALPVPRRDSGEDAAVQARAGCGRMSDFVTQVRQKLKPAVTNLAVRGIAPGSQPLVLWKDRQYAANRTRHDPGALRAQAGPLSEATVERAITVPGEPSDRKRYEAAIGQFCRVFPDAFYVSERVLVFLKEDNDSRGRLLSAGFHLMTGYFRDDAPLRDLILAPAGQKELDALWDEFHFITLDWARQYKDFIFFERAEPPRFMQGAEFDFARSEDKDATSDAKIRQLAAAYVAKARRHDAGEPALKAIEEYFEAMAANIRQVEQARLAAEPGHLQALLAFAERAWRRPLAQAERDELLTFYRTLRTTEGLDHEDAIRDVVVSLLMSPYFCYHVVDLTLGPGGPGERTRTQDRANAAPAATPANVKTRPLTENALANRLSYFLWASMPDGELLARARAGDLRRRAVLVGEVRRMLQDDRIRGLATEFGGNWLDFRRFEEHNAVDRRRFAMFDNELRAAMFEEPVRFLIDVARTDRSILDLLFANDTFVNRVLARHYGITGLPRTGPDEWVQVKDARRYDRGGLLPMSVFLTQNAPGLRTSPVKRGYWVARRLLGEQIPPPPPAVPELPNDETKLGDLTLRDALARHRADKSCAGCHARFDGLGLVFEGFGPVGERRDADLAGRPVDIRAVFPGGSEGAGLDGLRQYLRERRQDEFVENFCRKLLAYALNRTLLPSDDAIVGIMRAKLAANGHRFSTLIETIVTSPQFLNRRTDAGADINPASQ